MARLDESGEDPLKKITSEEMKLLTALRSKGIEPKLKTDAKWHLASVFGEEDEEPYGIPAHKRGSDLHHYPKFSIFFGEENRGEVTWDTFRYEVVAAITDEIFGEEQILLGIRRSLKGCAGDKLRRLGPHVKLGEVLEKLESAYSTVETKESIMKRFYTCVQKDNETVESFASRLEELFDKAVQLDALKRADTITLKQVLHSGLKKELKHMSVYQCDKIAAYDEFKRELRRMEADLKGESSDEKKPCKPAVHTEKREKTETSEFIDLVKQLNERMDILEKGRGPQQFEPHFERHQIGRGPPRGGWPGGGRGAARGRGDNNGRGYYRPQRTTGTNTFAPTCLLCIKKGHIQKNCPIILDQLVCVRCKEKGHFMRNCPN